MKKIKMYLSGFNNMLIFFFKLYLTKWRVIFDNRVLRIKGFTTDFNYYLLPSFDIILIKEHLILNSVNNRIMITIRVFKFIVYISFNNF